MQPECKVEVLDKGFVILRNLSGPTRRTMLDDLTVPSAFRAGRRPWDADDIDPAQAARMSFDQAFDPARPREADLKLAAYLMAHRHTTPWEMIEVWLEMKLPIFVARQFVRHRTVTINEVSARYIKLPAEWYVPKPENIGLRPANIKQGRSITVWADMTEAEREIAIDFTKDLNQRCYESYLDYEEYLRAGIPPELARCFLHVNHYTHWLWKQNLHNLFHFLSLRDDSHAQFEARAYAEAIIKLLDSALPHSMEVYRKYRRQPQSEV